ncbi:MAG: DMT family transporter [Candidatus Thorarchaeota archaeon]|jgi:drug/metabolite transporter (DMT)-like permease
MLAIIILLWGTNFVVSRFLTGIDPVRVSGILYAFFRYFLGTVTMVGLMLYQRMGLRSIQKEIQPYRSVLIIGALLSAVFVMALHMSTEFISSGTSSIIVNLSPIVVLIYGSIFLSEKLSNTKILGFLLGLLGGIAFFWSSLVLTSGLEWGIILALIAMFAWGAYTITLQYLEGADRFIVMTVKHGISTLMIIPFILVLIVEGVQLVLIIDFVSIAGLLFAGVLASGLAYLLYFAAIELLGAARASSFLFLIPFVSVAGDFVLGEPPELIALLTAAIALIGVGLVKKSGEDFRPTSNQAVVV